MSVTRRCMAGSVIAFAMSADHRNRRNRRNRRGPAYGHELIPFEDHLHDTDTSTQVTGLQVCTSIPALYILHCAARTGSSGPGMPADIAPGPRYVRSIAASVLETCLVYATTHVYALSSPRSPTHSPSRHPKSDLAQVHSLSVKCKEEQVREQHVYAFTTQNPEDY